MTQQTPAGVRNRALLRTNALIAGILTLLAGIAIFASDFHFPVYIGSVSIVISFFFFAYWALFDWLCRRSWVRGAGIALSQIGVVAVSAAVCCTGGVVSPLVFLYFAMLVAEALYGLENPYTMPFSIACYLLVVAGQYFAVLPAVAPWTLEAYRYPFLVSFLAALTSAYLVVTANMSARILAAMRAKLAAESAEKEALVRKFSELNATTQLGVLAHRIAHDLRGPIASISGYLELQQAGETDPEKRDTLQAMESTVNDLVQALHNITRFGKTSAPSREAVRLNDFLRDLVGIAAYSPKARYVELETVFAGNTDYVVTASRPELQQAFFNLIKNAVEAVADNAGLKKVVIGVSREGRNIHVLVSDNGPGMPEELLNTMFRKSVTTKKDGTGVGLLITRDLLIRNDGDIRLRNRETGGLEALVMLPAEK